jgi:hypothetical protein
MRRLLLILLPVVAFAQVDRFPVRVRLEVDTIKTITQPSILNILDSLRVVGTLTVTGTVNGFTLNSASAMDSLRVPALDEANTFAVEQTFADTAFFADAIYLGQNGYGKAIFYDPDGLKTGTLGVTTLSDNRTYNLPDVSGTVALTSNIPDTNRIAFVDKSNTFTGVDLLGLDSLSLRTMVASGPISATTGTFSNHIIGADSVVIYDKSNNDVAVLKFANAAGVVKGSLSAAVDGGAVTWTLADASGIVGLTNAGQGYPSIGSIGFVSTGKDIGTAAVPVDSLWVNRIVENYKAWGNLYIATADPDTVTTAAATDTVTMRGWNKTGSYQNVTLSDSGITVTRAGTYRITHTSSFYASTPAVTHAFLHVNQGLRVEGAFERTLATAAQLGSAGFSTIISLAANDFVKVRYHGDAAETFYITHASFNVERID